VFRSPSTQSGEKREYDETVSSVSGANAAHNVPFMFVPLVCKRSVTRRRTERNADPSGVLGPAFLYDLE
jgi:hypothetical protein